MTRIDIYTFAYRSKECGGYTHGFGCVPRGGRFEIPCDRDATFEPQLIPKHQCRIPGFDEKILFLYAKGMITRDIQEIINKLYDVDISLTLVSEITEDLDVEVTRVADSSPRWSLSNCLYGWGLSFMFAINLDVLHPPLSMSIGEILKKLSETGLPYLYLPSEESFVLVDAIPVLGMDKLDL